MSVTNCPSCNTPVPPGSIFCDNCGYDLRGAVPAAATPAPPPLQSPGAGDGNISCPSCGHMNIPGSAFCENCGSQLSGVQAPEPPYQPPAEPVPAPPPVQPPPVLEAPPPQPAPVTPVAGVTGRLTIQASNASLPIPEGKSTVVLGREDPVSGIFPDVDLDPYGAQEEGVGRKHAQLILQGGQVFIEDLDSVNGTVVNKQRIPPNQPHPINDGDELRLGKMVLIYHTG